MDISEISGMIARFEKAELSRIAGRDDNGSHRLWANTALQMIGYVEARDVAAMVKHLSADCDSRVELQLGAVELCKKEKWRLPLRMVADLPKSGGRVSPRVLDAVRDTVKPKFVRRAEKALTTVKTAFRGMRH